MCAASDYMQTGASVWHGGIPLCGEGCKPEISAREQDLFRDGRLAFPVSLAQNATADDFAVIFLIPERPGR